MNAIVVGGKGLYDLVVVEDVKEHIKINYKGDVSTNQDKANCLSTKNYQSYMDLICVAQRGRAYRGDTPKLEQAIEVGKTNFILQRPRGENKGGLHTDKSPTISANAW